jgi:ubiquinone/menaquinone biosynthesis C-methylase UbiE
MAITALETSLRDAPFDALADTYDQTFTFSRIGRAQREAVTREMDRVFRSGQRVLEINCGTGVDALHLASHGVAVLACDVAPRMIEVARQRAKKAQMEDSIGAPVEFRALATERIGVLRDEGLAGYFDGVLSNFAGLNCIEDPSLLARDLAQLLKPGASVLFCLFGRLCAWEVLWYLGQGKPREAFRRFRSAGDTVRIARGATVRVCYPAVRKLAHLFSPEFQLKGWKGIGVTVPPTYLEPLACRFPKVLRALAGFDRGLGRCPGLRGMADHVLLRFERVRG